jgi:hypothetical protein
MSGILAQVLFLNKRNCYFYPSYLALGTYRAGRQLHIIEQFGSVTIFASDAYRYIAGIVYLSEMA